MSQTFEHPALVYRDLDEFVAPMRRFVTEGLERDEPVFVAIGREELAALRGSVGAGAPVRWHDTNEWHPVPGTRLRAFHSFVGDALRDGARRIRLVGEPLWPAGAPELSREWARYESALNAVLAPFPVTLVCTYDAARLGPEIVADAARTHPVIGLHEQERPSPDFVDPETLVARWTAPLDPPPADARTPRDPVDPASARAMIRDLASLAGVAPERVFDVELAVDEIVTNALLHGGGGPTVRAWVADGYVLCQVDDLGPGPGDPLVGYRPPGLEDVHGRGLWLTRQVVDLLEVVPATTGTSVRVRVRIDP